MKGLCYRCEYRAQYHEIGHAPRYECGEPDKAVCSCYMYRPVAPCILGVNDGEDRSPFLPAMVAGRSHQLGIAECDYKLVGDEKRYTVWPVPKEDENAVG